MKARELIYELLQGELDDEVRIYDSEKMVFYKIIRFDSDKGIIDLVFDSKEEI